MKIIKLNATDSTNSFLKELEQNINLQSFTVVVTNMQLKGRGQQHDLWVSEPYKNLTFSVLVYFSDLQVFYKKYLNFAISLAVFEVLKEEKIPNLSIKWPNDILSGNKKIGGILIENNLKGLKIASTILGIGLNVNQINFPKDLKKVSSLKLLTKTDFNLDVLLKKILENLKEKMVLLTKKEFALLESNYLNYLYKKNIATMFKDSNNVLFMGLIRGVSIDGKLQVELEDETIKEFGIKEISLA